MTSTKQQVKANAAVGAIIGLAILVIASGCSDSTPTAGTGTASTNSTVAASPGTSAPPDTAHSMNHRSMDSHAMGNTGLTALKSLQGKNFDIAFLSQMIAHHEAAVQMAKQALSTASKPETKNNAQKVIDSQTKEIAQMTKWLKEWYGVSPSATQQALVNKDMEGMMAMPVSSDTMFYEMMIPHHQGAIDMSELASKNAGRAEVKELAREISTAQKAEIAAYHRQMGHGG